MITRILKWAYKHPTLFVVLLHVGAVILSIAIVATAKALLPDFFIPIKDL